MRSRSAWIIVVDNQTLMSSCVVNRERSWLDLRTEKIGKSSSWQTVSQNSTGYVLPYVLSVENRESSALKEVKAVKRYRKEWTYSRRISRSSPFMMISKNPNSTGNQNLIMTSSIAWAVAPFSGWLLREHSGISNITGITPRSIAIANRLIFWYLLTLQNSVIQTVRSAKAPYWTIAGKCSLFNRVTISNAELAIRSNKWLQRSAPHCWESNWPVKTLDAAEKTPNMVLQPDRIFWERACIICCKHWRTYGWKSFRYNRGYEIEEAKPSHEFQGCDCVSWCIRRVSENSFET